MFVLKDLEDNYIKSLEDNKIKTTNKLNEALIFEYFSDADAFLKFVEKYQEGYWEDDFLLYEIDFRRVDN